jgi:uncharacterized coiled-coil DUF342 family protein
VLLSPNSFILLDVVKTYSLADVVTFAGVLTAFLAAFGTYRKIDADATKTKADASKVKAEALAIETKAQSDAQAEVQEAMIANLRELMDFYKDLTDQVSGEYKKLSAEMGIMREEFNRCRSKLTRFSEHMHELSDALNESVNLRNKELAMLDDSPHCAAFRASDEQLLKRLNRIEDIFAEDACEKPIQPTQTKGHLS